jgi:Ca2+-binding RTX toxin-like protein
VGGTGADVLLHGVGGTGADVLIQGVGGTGADVLAQGVGGTGADVLATAIPFKPTALAKIIMAKTVETNNLLIDPSE